MQVSRWGDGLALPLPQAQVDEPRLKEGGELASVTAKPGQPEVATAE